MAMRSHWRARAAISIGGAVGLLVAGAVPALAPASAAVSSTYAVSALLVGGSATNVAADPVTGTVYIALGAARAIDVTNGSTGKVTSTISLAFGPLAMAVDPATDTIYAIGESDVAAVINGKTNQVVTTIPLPAITRSISAAVNPVTDKVYVADNYNGTVDVIDGKTDAVTVIPVGGVVRSVAVDTANNQVYVCDSDQVVVIDGATNTVTDKVTLGAGANPFRVAVDPSAGRVYVADYGTSAGTGNVSLINVATDKASTLTTGLDRPSGIAVDSASGTLYVTTRYGTAPGGNLSLGATDVIDAASGTVITTIPRGGFIAALGSSGTVYIPYGYMPYTEHGAVLTITPSATDTMSPLVSYVPSGLTWTVGQASTVTLAVSATPAASFSASGLPAGLALSPAGVISGIPAAGTEGTHTISVTATNGIAPADTATFYLTVTQPPAITSADQATFTTGAPGSFTATASGYPAPTFTETGLLPDGVTLTGSGTLSGTPAYGQGGAYHIVISAANGSSPAATQAFTLNVDQQPGFSTSRFDLTLRPGHWRKLTFNARGFPAPRLTRSGRLPRGIRFRALGTLAKISGRAARSTRHHTYRFVIRARNGVGAAARLIITIRVT